MLDHISFVYFIQQMAQHPVLLISVLLTLGVIFVNGWTDAPNAIATCVSTRCIDVDHAIIMAAICNFFGVMVMSLINSSVAMTIKNMVNFGGNNEDALIALCAAMAAIVIWAIGAWYFGIPTSESHALDRGAQWSGDRTSGRTGRHKFFRVDQSHLRTCLIDRHRLCGWLSGVQDRYADLREHGPEKDEPLF